MKRTVVGLALVIILCAIIVTISSCATSAPLSTQQAPMDTDDVITGSISYPNNLYFPSKIRIEITLYSANSSQQTERTLAVQTIRNPQKFPVNYTLRYDTREIKNSEIHYIFVEVFQEDTDTPYLTSDRKYRVNLLGVTTIPSIHINLMQTSPIER